MFIIILCIAIFVLVIIFCKSLDKDEKKAAEASRIKAEEERKRREDFKRETQRHSEYILEELKKHPKYSEFSKNCASFFVQNGGELGFDNLKSYSNSFVCGFNYKEGLALVISVVGDMVYFYPHEKNAFYSEVPGEYTADFHRVCKPDFSRRTPIAPIEVHMDDIMYYHMMGDEHLYTTVSGGGSTLDKKGAIVGGIVGNAIGGQAGASVGAVLGSGIGQSAPIQTSVKKKDTRVMELLFVKDGIGKRIEFAGDFYTDGTRKDLLKLLPEKDLAWIQNSQKKSAEASANEKLSAADEILKFKNLLDQGVISQEEFDTKKKQLLDM